MSVNATGPVSNIWSKATTALTNSPPPQSEAPEAAAPRKDAAGRPPPSAAADTTRANPFQQLSSSLQSVLIQMQSGIQGP